MKNKNSKKSKKQSKPVLAITSSKFEDYKPGSIVRLKSNCGFTPAGTYKVENVSDGMVCMQVGEVYFGIGEMYANRMEIVEDEIIELTNEEVVREYAEKVIKQLDYLSRSDGPKILTNVH